MVRVILKKKYRDCTSDCSGCLSESFSRAVKRLVHYVENVGSNMPTIIMDPYSLQKRTYVLPRPLRSLAKKLRTCSKVTFYAKNLKEAKNGY